MKTLGAMDSLCMYWVNTLAINYQEIENAHLMKKFEMVVDSSLLLKDDIDFSSFIKHMRESQESTGTK